MTDQISTVGLAVDSSQVLSASETLRKFAQEGNKAESAATAVERASASMNTQLTKVGSGVQQMVRLASAQKEAASASQTLATEGAKVARAGDSVASAYRKETEAVNQLVPAVVAAATATKTLPLSLNGLQSEGIKKINAELGQMTTAASRSAYAVSAVAVESAVSANKAATTWRQFVGQRMGPLMREFSEQGVPHSEAHTKAIRQISAEWQQYKKSALSAQQEVANNAKGADASAGIVRLNAELNKTTSEATRAANAVGLIQSKAKSVSFVRSQTGVTPTTGVPSITGVGQLTTGAATAKSAVNGVTYAVNAQTTALTAASAALKKTYEDTQRLQSLNANIASAGNIARNFQPGKIANVSVGDGASLSATSAALRQVADQTERIRKYKPVNPFQQNAVTQLIAAGAATKALGQHQDAQAKSAKRAAYENQQLSFQIHDFLVQVASGGSPLTALVQQGSQLSGTFGGTGNAIRAVLGLLTPFRLAVAGVAGVVGGLGYGLYSSAERIKQFKNAITLTGNFSGQTQGGFNVLSERVATSANSGISQARELSLALLQTGEVSQASLQKAATAAVLYQRATEKTTEAVTDDFVNLTRAPADFAQKLDRQFHFLTTAQVEAIKKFEENGQTTQALDVIYGALIQRMGSIQQNMGQIDQKVDSASKSWQRLKESVKSVFDEFNAGPTIEQRIERLTNRLNSLPVDGKKLRNAVTRSDVQAELDAAISEKAENDRRAEFQAEEQRRQQRGKAAISLIDGYEKAGKASDILKQKTRELNDAFDSAEQNGVKISKQQRADALAGLQKQYGNQSAISEKGQVQKATLEGDLKKIQDAFQRERDTYSFQNQFLQGEYQNGQISLRQFFRDKREIATNAVQAEIAALDEEKARLEDYIKVTKDPSERIQAKTRVDEIGAQQTRIRTEGGREQSLINQEQAASFRALSDQITNYKANLLQLEGDELGAARVRAQAAIENAKILATQASVRPGVTPIDVAGYARAIELSDQFAEVQRRAQILSQSSANAENAFALAAEQRGLSLRETEQGIFAIRSQELNQLGLLVEKAKELADASTDPRIKQFAADLTLEYAKAAAAVDPALSRLREATRQLAADLANTVTNLPQTFADAYARRRQDAFDDIRNQKSEYDRRIDILEGYLAESQDKQDKARLRARIKDLEDQKRNAKGPSKVSSLFGALGDSLLKPALTTVTTAANKVLIVDPLQRFIEGQLKGATEGDNAFGNALREIMGVKANPQDAAIAAQTAQITSTTSALQLLELAAQRASDSLNAKAGIAPVGSGFALKAIGPDSELGDTADAFGKSVEDSTDATSDFSKIVPTATNVITRLASAAGGANQALSLMPSIISLVQASAATSSASSSGGGFFGMLASIFSKGGSSGGGGGGAMSNEVFHDGGIVGQPSVTRMASQTLLDHAARYHSGGIVGRAADKLKYREVPAILMEGEEVLKGSDPRHRYNLGGDVMDIIRAAEGRSRNEVQELLARFRGQPKRNAVAEMADIQVRGNREMGGSVSAGATYRVNERGPELLQVAGKQYLMMGNQSGNVKPAAESSGKTVQIVQHLHFNTGGQPVDRRTADQVAAAASSGARRALVRNS